jgi:hypothetical protein
MNVKQIRLLNYQTIKYNIGTYHILGLPKSRKHIVYERILHDTMTP